MICASIVLYNTKESDLIKVLECTISSLVDHIFVVDNSPTNKLWELINAYKNSRIHYRFGHGNIGYGAAHNLAIKEAISLGATYHVILNPDIYFEKGVLESIQDFMHNHEDVGYLLPNVIYPNGDQQYLCKLLPSPLNILGRKVLPKLILDRMNEKFEMRATGYNQIRNVPILSGCFMFLRLDVIKAVGMFDDRFFMYFEDFDLIRRIHKVSKTVFYPEVNIVHNHAAEHRTNKKLLRISMQSAIMYFNKWGWIFDIDRWCINRHAFDDENIIRT